MIPSPLYKDPIYNGAADPMIIRKESDGKYYMFYTQRRANQQVEGVSYCYGAQIGVAESLEGSKWHYRGSLNLNFEFGHNTFWAPEIIYNAQEQLYHMYVSYTQGIYTDWEGKFTIEHYTSKDLFNWIHIGSISFGTGRIIDPCIYRLPNGTWRMWYKDEDQGACICYADSPNLYDWVYKGICLNDQRQEGPNVFEFKGKYWMITDPADGFSVYSSNDLTQFSLQNGNILRESGTRVDDIGHGGHADIFVVGERAFMVYFTHPDPNYHPRSAIQMAELVYENGILTCDRNRVFETNWPTK